MTHDTLLLTPGGGELVEAVAVHQPPVPDGAVGVVPHDLEHNNHYKCSHSALSLLMTSPC